MTRPLVCAIRGGPGSTTTRRRAFAKAKAAGARLHFVSVIEARGYDSLQEGEQRAIKAETKWRDHVLAETSRTATEAEDVDYEVAVRVGELVPTLVEYASEVGADRVMIGEAGAAPDAALSADEMSALVNALGGVNLGVEVLT